MPSSSTTSSSATSRTERPDAALSLYHLLDPEVLADPYPLFARLRREDPVHWDPFLHAWIVTRYADVMEVLHTFSADRTPTPEQLAAMGLAHLSPIAKVMVQHDALHGCTRAYPPAQPGLQSLHARACGKAALAYSRNCRPPARWRRVRGNHGRDRPISPNRFPPS